MICPLCDCENDDDAKKRRMCGKKFDIIDVEVKKEDKKAEPSSEKDLQKDTKEITKVDQQPKHEKQETNTDNNYFQDSGYVQRHDTTQQNQQQNLGPEYFQTNQQYNNQQYQQQQFNQQQQYNQQYQQQQYNPNAQRPIKQKSKLIGVVLAILICGAGYCYVDQWGKGIAFFLISAVLDFLTTFFVATFFFAIFGLIPFGLWLILRIFTIIDVFGKVDKYNAGLLY